MHYTDIITLKLPAGGGEGNNDPSSGELTVCCRTVVSHLGRTESVSQLLLFVCFVELHCNCFLVGRLLFPCCQVEKRYLVS